LPLPPIFGSSWEEFMANWSLGNPPSLDRETVETALSALNKLWPEREAMLVNGPTRGPLPLSSAMQHGTILAKCERLAGFENVLRRVRTGERSALSELTFAARLIEAGFEPVLEPPSKSGVLDTLVRSEYGDIYCEVIAPDMSDAIAEITNDASSLATQLRDQNTGMRAEVLFSVDIDKDNSKRVAEAVALLPALEDIQVVGEIAVVSKKQFEAGDHIGASIPAPDSAGIIGNAQASELNGVRTVGIVRVPVSDARAKRLLSGESHHFSREEMNILVMDVTRIASSPQKWAELIGRCLQPNQNRRFGAVILLTSGVRAESKVVHRWRVVRNPYAYKPIPEEFLQKIASAY
jgi:hypothetical protein